MAPSHAPSSKPKEIVVVQELGRSETEGGSRKRRKSIVMNGSTSPKVNGDLPSLVTSTTMNGSPRARKVNGSAANGIGARGSLVVGK
jgi:hypothetical protein